MAMPLPMPRLAPVTTATLPESEPIPSSLLLRRDGFRVRRLGELEARQVALGAPLAQHLQEVVRARRVAAEQRPLRLGLAFVVEVAGGALAEEARGVELVLAHVGDVAV